MTLPRPFAPQTTYMLTRRTLERRFFLNPDPQTAATLLFILGLYSAKHTIKVHAFVFMSNHVHLIITDTKGNLPDFTRDFYSSVARVMNKNLNRCENFWAVGTGGATTLLDVQTIVDKITYVITNPVAAGIVPVHTRWRLPSSHNKTPLLSTFGAIKRKDRKRISRPKNYYKKKGSAVKDYSIVNLEPPPGLNEKEFILALEHAVNAREIQLQEEQRSRQKPYLGMKNALKTQQSFVPKSPLKKSSKINPILACTDPIQLMNEKIKLKYWRQAYRGSLSKVREGKVNFPFPENTYGNKKIFKIITAPLESVLHALSPG